MSFVVAVVIMTYPCCVCKSAMHTQSRPNIQVREAIQALLNDGTIQLRKAADSDVMRFGLSTDAEVAENHKCAAHQCLV